MFWIVEWRGHIFLLSKIEVAKIERIEVFVGWNELSFIYGKCLKPCFNISVFDSVMVEVRGIVPDQFSLNNIIKDTSNMIQKYEHNDN